MQEAMRADTKAGRTFIFDDSWSVDIMSVRKKSKYGSGSHGNVPLRGDSSPGFRVGHTI
jgi:hypothetical protein